MAIEYIGDAWLVIEGKDVEVKDVKISRRDMRKTVKTMNRTGHAIGFVKKSATGELTFTAPVRKIENVDLGELEDVLIVVEPSGGGAKRKCMGCITTNIEESYGGDESAQYAVTVEFVNYIKE